MTFDAHRQRRALLVTGAVAAAVTAVGVPAVLWWRGRSAGPDPGGANVSPPSPEPSGRLVWPPLSDVHPYDVGPLIRPHRTPPAWM
jgi:hypothetical protein